MTGHLPRWQVTRGCSLAWRRWDDEFVVYNSGSGDTHVLDLLSGEVLRALERSPLTVTEIEERLAPQIDMDPGQDLSQYLSNLLPELRNLGLIEPSFQ